MRSIVYVFVALLACGVSFGYDLELLTEDQWNELVENNRKLRSKIVIVIIVIVIRDLYS